MRTPLIVALATTLVGCSYQPLHQVAAVSRPSIAAKTERPSSYRPRDRSHLATKSAKPIIIAAKPAPPATRIPFPPHSLRTHPKSSATADSNKAETNIADSHPRVGPAPVSSGRSIQEQVAAATTVAERITGATGAPNNADHLVAIVIVRPEIKSVSDLTGKNIAIDDRYLVSGADVRIAIAAAGAPSVQLSAGNTTAIDRLVEGEVLAAVVAVVSADAAEGFPEIAGFKIFRIPLR